MPSQQATTNTYINAILTATIIGLMGWTLLTVHELSVSVGRIEEKVKNLNDYVERQDP